jgi:hypothetical protein
MTEQSLKRPTLRPIKADDQLRLNGAPIGDNAGFWKWALATYATTPCSACLENGSWAFSLGLKMNTRENWTSRRNGHRASTPEQAGILKPELIA